MLKGEIGYFGLSDWWMSEFSSEERVWISDQYKPFFMSVLGGVADQAGRLEQTEFTYISSDAVIFLDGLLSWTEKRSEIYEKINKKIEILASESVSFDIDLDRFNSDKYYRSWFLSRSNFFFKLNESINSPDIAAILWDAVDDHLSTPLCKALDSKIFMKNDPSLINIANEHWGELRHGCRCSLIQFGDHDLEDWLSTN